jgi:hypothetical protein
MSLQIDMIIQENTSILKEVDYLYKLGKTIRLKFKFPFQVDFFEVEVDLAVCG